MRTNFKMYVRILIVFIVFFVILAIFALPPLVHALNYSQTYKVDFQFAYKQVWNKPFTSLSYCLKPENSASYYSSLGLLGFILGVAAIISMSKVKPENSYEGIEHGSGDWAAGGEQYKVLSKNSGILLAKKHFLPLNKHGNVNVLVVGGSGSGKSAAYVTPNATLLHGSYVYTDPKGELFNNTAGFFRKNGYDVKVLNLVRPENSDGFNPLMNIASESDVDIIAHTIVKGQGGESKDPYWDDMAELLLKALIYYLIAKRPVEEQNLASAAELVRNANTAGDINILSDLIYELPASHPARKNYSSVEIAPEKAFGSILSTLQSRLGKFDPKDIAALTATNTIDFDQIAQKKTVLYVISSDTHGTYDFILTIFFSQMIQRLYDFADENGGALPTRTYFFLDEFANIGRIPDFDKKISTSRSRGISFSIILQTLDQLEAVYEKSHETIIGNCDTHLFLGSNSQKTLEYFSKALGEKTISRDSVSRTEKDGDSSDKSKTYSDSIYGRALMTPDELRRMPTDECIIYESGIKPIKAEKHMWYKDRKMLSDLGNQKEQHHTYVVDRGEWQIFDPHRKEKSEDVDKRLAELFKDEEDNIRTKPIDKDEVDEFKNTQAFKGKNEYKDNKLNQSNRDNQNKSNQNKQKSNNEKSQNKNVGNTNQEKEVVSNFSNKEEFDLEKELEAKFDELFGKIEKEEELAKKE